MSLIKRAAKGHKCASRAADGRYTLSEDPSLENDRERLFELARSLAKNHRGRRGSILLSLSLSLFLSILCRRLRFAQERDDTFHRQRGKKYLRREEKRGDRNGDDVGERCDGRRREEGEVDRSQIEAEVSGKR